MNNRGLRLEDRVAIVTGGGGGLGAGICGCLADEGAHVVVSDLDLELATRTSKAVEQAGRKALAIGTDVTSEEQCGALVEMTMREMGRLDILVCAAGVGGGPPMLESISEELWDRTIDVNLKGVFLCNRAVAPHFRQQRSGKIINISSIGGRKGIDWIPAYSASKAGVIVFSQAVALQLAPFNVNVNTICPGLIWTPMWAAGAEDLARWLEPLKGKPPEEVFEMMVKQMVPLGRPQTPESIGRAAVFLASDDSADITGQAINVDGGALLN